MPSGRSLGTLPGPPGSYESLAYSASGRWLAAVRHTGDAYTVLAWDLATRGDPIVVGPGLDFRFLPGTDDLVAAELDDPTLTVYDLEPDGTIQKDRQIARPDVSFQAMAVDPSGHLGRGGVARRSPRRRPRPRHRSIASHPRHAEPRPAGVQRETATWRSAAATT